MPDTKITWGYGHTMNLGNFESLRVDHAVEDYIRDGETYTEASNRIKQRARQECLDEIVAFHKEWESRNASEE